MTSWSQSNNFTVAARAPFQKRYMPKKKLGTNVTISLYKEINHISLTSPSLPC
jgi:hypothetical protein